MASSRSADLREVINTLFYFRHLAGVEAEAMRDIPGYRRTGSMACCSVGRERRTIPQASSTWRVPGSPAQRRAYGDWILSPK